MLILLCLTFTFDCAIDIFSAGRSTITTSHLNLVMLDFYFSLCMVIITWMQWSQHCGHKPINDTMFKPSRLCFIDSNLHYGLWVCLLTTYLWSSLSLLMHILPQNFIICVYLLPNHNEAWQGNRCDWMVEGVFCVYVKRVIILTKNGNSLAFVFIGAYFPQKFHHMWLFCCQIIIKLGKGNSPTDGARCIFEEACDLHHQIFI